MTKNELKRDMRAFVEKLRTVRVGESPNMRVSVMLASALKRNGLPDVTAETMALRAELKISEKLFLEDQAFVEEVVDGVAVGIAHLYRAIKENFTALNADNEIVLMSSKFSLELEI